MSHESPNLGVVVTLFHICNDIFDPPKNIASKVTITNSTVLIQSKQFAGFLCCIWFKDEQKRHKKCNSPLSLRLGSPAIKQGDEKLVYRLIQLFSSTEIFSKRRKIYAC